MARYDRPRSTVRSIINRAKTYSCKSYENKPRTSALRKTTARDDRELVRHAITYTKETLYSLVTPSKLTKQLGRNLVRKILKNAGKAKRKPRKKPFLKPEHKKIRVS